MLRLGDTEYTTSFFFLACFDVDVVSASLFLFLDFVGVGSACGL
jgi:hypothetical protein